jgi:Ca2+-binding EF-hand superfamily protein
MTARRQFIPHFEGHSVLLIASWTLCIAGAAYAQTPTPASDAAATDRDVSAAFREADQNGDGRLNREEAAVLPSVAENFDRIDTNQDGSISLDELAKAVQK